MKGSCATSAELVALRSSFEELRRRLLEGNRQDCLDRPLAYWALPNDRRLPYALLHRTVGEVVRGSFDAVSSTPRIGRKKIASLLMLLHRVLEQGMAAGGIGQREAMAGAEKAGNGAFEPGLVSESLWEQWRHTVRRHGLEQERLGRLVPSLQSLPTVIWGTPLSTYLDLSLSQLWGLKTHGRKRVRIVLDVFRSLHELLGSAARHRHLAVQLRPRFLEPLEQWVRDELGRRAIPELQELRQNLVLPLLNQIEVDAGETVQRLAAGRLGIESPAESARQQAARMGVTRARIYQLLEMCGQVMAVRWPEGRWELALLSRKFEPLPPADHRSRLLGDTRALMFPERKTAGRRELALAEAVS